MAPRRGRAKRREALGPVALLELLAGAAPARVVAADLVLLVDVPGLDEHRGLVLDLGVIAVLLARAGNGAGRRRGGRRRERARLVLGGTAREGEIRGRAHV